MQQNPLRILGFVIHLLLAIREFLEKVPLAFPMIAAIDSIGKVPHLATHLCNDLKNLHVEHVHPRRLECGEFWVSIIIHLVDDLHFLELLPSQAFQIHVQEVSQQGLSFSTALAHFAVAIDFLMWV